MYGIEIKQQAKVKYLGCSLGLRLSGESIALNVIDNVNPRLKLYCTDTTSFWLYLHNLVYTCHNINAWSSAYHKKRSKICVKQVFQLKLLNPHDKQLQFIVSGIFKFYNIQWLDYFKYFFYPVGENSVITHCSNKKLKIPFQKTELGIPCLSYLGPISFVGLRTFVAFLCYPYRHSVFYIFIFKFVMMIFLYFPYITMR